MPERKWRSFSDVFARLGLLGCAAAEVIAAVSVFVVLPILLAVVVAFVCGLVAALLIAQAIYGELDAEDG